MAPKGDVTQQYCLVQPKEKAPQAGEAAAATPTPPEQQPQSANPRACCSRVWLDWIDLKKITKAKDEDGSYQLVLFK
uniref:Uncharacterized protein n=1 Tax=Oryza rufipogon TaxID=4529 RepID=A0A0E0P543_ORYRU